jgi:coenzyme Q-binding protein COQ10
MHSYDVTHRIGHSAAEMFNLVADVEKYPLYLPLCEALSVTKRERRDDGTELLIARMTVGYRLVRESLTTQVILNAPERLILVEYLDGPFSFLENRWRFTPVGEAACDIAFHIRYTFRSRMLERLMGGLFGKAVRRYTAAFEARADQVYGPPAGPAEPIG